LPQNVEAERSVLGAILLENQAINQAQEILDGDDFSRESHRRIFRAMEELSERSAVIDLVTVKNELSRQGALDRVGGASYISSLVDGVPKSANVEHYAKIVKEKAILRLLIQASEKISISAHRAEEEPETILDEAQRMVFEIAQDRVRAGFVPLRDLAEGTLKHIEQLTESQQLVTGIASGYERLDELTSGFQKTDLVVVAARPSMGKTALCLNVAIHAAVTHGKPIGIFSLEMSREQLFLRMLCSQARVDAHRLRTGRLGKEEWTRLSRGFSALTEAPIFIDDTPGIGIMEMRAKARRLQAEHGLDLLMVDYLQLMRGRSQRSENRTQEVSEISRSLKGLAKELDIPLLAVSQLSRAPEQRGSDRRPQLSDLRESGAIEQDADVVLFIYREEVHKPTEDNRGIAQIIIGKQRNGPIGTLNLAFLKEFTRFENLEFQREEQF
jgi:replicative DNA helicase